jgi:FkbM family methyltransferase
VVFDVGANVGCYTILSSRLVGSGGRVLAFEPVVRNLAYLYRHVYLNRARNVTILPVACSDTLSLSDFLLETDCGLGHLDDGGAGRPVAIHNGRTLVPTVTVDGVVERLGVAPDVMKIDAEGAEFKVLQGAQATLRTALPTIFLSVHSADLRSACLNYLGALQYVPRPLGADGANATEYVFRVG